MAPPDTQNTEHYGVRLLKAIPPSAITAITTIAPTRIGQAFTDEASAEAAEFAWLLVEVVELPVLPGVTVPLLLLPPMLLPAPPALSVPPAELPPVGDVLVVKLVPPVL